MNRVHVWILGQYKKASRIGINSQKHSVKTTCMLQPMIIVVSKSGQYFGDPEEI